MGAGGLVGEAGVVEGLVEEIAGAIAGEDAAGAVGAVGTGGEADDDEAGFGIAEGGDGEAPVGFVAIGAALGLGDGLAVLAEAGALVAVGDLFLEVLQAHFVQRTLWAYDTTNGNGGGSGGGDGFRGGFEAGFIGRRAGAEGGLSELAGVGGER